jgi:hypothetical protein
MGPKELKSCSLCRGGGGGNNLMGKFFITLIPSPRHKYDYAILLHMRFRFVDLLAYIIDAGFNYDDFYLKTSHSKFGLKKIKNP